MFNELLLWYPRRVFLVLATETAEGSPSRWVGDGCHP